MLASATLQTLIPTVRLSEAEKFYGHTLGLPLKGRSHDALVYEVGGHELRVSPVPGWRPSGHTVWDSRSATLLRRWRNSARTASPLSASRIFRRMSRACS